MIGTATGQNAKTGPLCSIVMDDAEAAIENCTRLIESGKLSGAALVRAYLARSAAYDRKRDYRRSIDDATKIIEIRPKDTLGYLGRGSGYVLTAEYVRAIEDFSKVIELEPRSEEGYAARSGAYSRKGEHDRAIADATTVIEIAPKRASSYSNRAWAYLRAGNAALALTDANRALELSREPFDHYFYTRAQVLEALGRQEESISDYRQALRLAPAHKTYQEALRRLHADQ